MANMEDDVNDVENDVEQQDDRMTIVEENVFINTNEIAG